MWTKIVILASAALMLTAPLPAQAVELVMIERDGCAYCDRWNDEIAPIYPKTPEGAFAPLRRMDVKERPDDIEFSSRPVLTPTFVLVDEGRELMRIEGYGGDDLFWSMLSVILRDYTDFDVDAQIETTPDTDLIGATPTK
ncbi:hypothetical protein [Celeribacter marinus]|uniref:hypothetical protein n=1 Tax=Celeribacter marinus TaxID=1397108 RepID=UPI003F6D834A